MDNVEDVITTTKREISTENDKEKLKEDKSFLLKILQGMLIGLGAVLPGISGGVLCVVFGIYTTIMELLADPIHNFKTHIKTLLPVIIGGVAGFVGIAGLLSYFLEKYEAPSICLFVGLIVGMIPSLWKEAGKEGRNKASIIALVSSILVTLTILLAISRVSANIVPNVWWNIFCGVCLALSVIVPGMSFSTLLMPLGLYEPFVSGIGHMDFAILIPAGIGALLTVVLLAKAVEELFKKRYSVAFHVILGIVISATIVIIPIDSFLKSLVACMVNTICLVLGVVMSVMLDRFNSKYKD